MNIELVNNWYPVFIFIGGKTELYLFFGVFADGKTWQIIEGEIGAFARFDIRAEVAAYYFAEHENFGNAVSIQRRIVAVAVVNGDKAGRHDIKACFFTGFFDDVVTIDTKILTGFKQTAHGRINLGYRIIGGCH